MADIAAWDWRPNGETIVSEWLPIETAPKDGQHILLLATCTKHGARCWWMTLGNWMSGFGSTMDTKCWEDCYGAWHPDLSEHQRRPEDTKVLYWSKIMQLPRG